MKKYMIALSAMVVFAAGIACGQPRTSTMAPPSPETWITRKWTGSDIPYKQAEARVIADFTSGKGSSAIAQFYKDEAQRHPHDLVAQFVAVYAERAAYVASHPGAEIPIPKSLVYKLEEIDPGNVHEIARCRFIMIREADLTLPFKDVKIMGERLLRYDSNDTYTRRCFIVLLRNSNEGIKLALSYAQEWVKQEPNDPIAHASLADVYFGAWEVSNRKSRDYGNKAITEYQEYLRLAPPDAGFRQSAESFIKYIQDSEVKSK